MGFRYNDCPLQRKPRHSGLDGTYSTPISKGTVTSILKEEDLASLKATN